MMPPAENQRPNWLFGRGEEKKTQRLLVVEIRIRVYTGKY